MNKDNLYDAPQDELNEYTDFKIGLKRFCFDNNRNVLLEIGYEKKFYIYITIFLMLWKIDGTNKLLN